MRRAGSKGSDNHEDVADNEVEYDASLLNCTREELRQPLVG